MDAEDGSQLVRSRAHGDQSVARGGTKAFAGAVYQDQSGDSRPRSSDEQHAHAAYRGEPVPHGSHDFVASPAISDDAANQPHQHGCALIKPIDEAELQRRELKIKDNV